MIKGINIVTDRRDPDTQLPERANNWFSLAKNVAWIGGIVVVVTVTITSFSNANNTINAKQDDQIARTALEVKELKADINVIKGSQTDQLVMLTKLLTIAERMNPTYANSKPNKE